MEVTCDWCCRRVTVGPHRLSWLRPVALMTVVVLSLLVTRVSAQQEWDHWEPPWKDFENSVVVRTYYGDVRGFSVPWHVEDEAWNPEWDEQPRWYVQRVNCFLGIPYANPPLGIQRFQRPLRPRWVGTWEANYFRPSCPQEIEYIRRDIPDYPKANISEDCLYMNIFAPNITWHSLQTLYPVVVFIHGGDFVNGTAQFYPGQVLVRHEIVVVTFNYRLGALGFLTTEDEHGAGNWGLLDQQLALEFIKENIKAFRGDPNQITLMGDGAGASSVGHHIISPMSNNKGFFHKAILMGGSDMAGSAYINPFWRPQEYAFKLGKILRCPTDNSFNLVMCLRNNRTITWRMIVEAQSKIDPNDGALGRVWGPVQDGGYYNTWPFLPLTPPDLRREEKFAKIPIIIGINQQEGVQRASELVSGLGNGMFPVTFENFMTKQLRDWKVMDRYWQRAYEAVEFQYTYWPDPMNRTARAQEFINMITDLDYGIGMNRVIRYHAPYESSYQYVWSYKSWDDYEPHWKGSYGSSQIPYVFGYPFMNETVLNETELVMKQWYDYEDRNMSDCTMLIWTNFIKYTIPTPNVTCNLTWEPFQEHNLTYAIFDYHKHLWFHYRQSKYGFWESYFPTIAKQDYLHPTATPTPMGHEYVYATGSMAAILIVALIVVGVCIFLLIQQSRKEEEGEAFADSELPLSFTTSRSQSQATVSTRRGHSPDESFAQPYGQYNEASSGQYPSDYKVPYGQQYRTQQYQSEV